MDRSRIHLEPDKQYLGLGPTGCGKSYWIRARLESADPARLIVLDPGDEYDELGGRRLAVIEDLRELGGLFARRRARYAVSVRVPYLHDHLEAIALLVFEGARAWGPVCLVIEELADFLVRPGICGREYRRLTNQGRKWGLCMVTTSQRPGELVPCVRANAYVTACWQLDEDTDLAWVRAKIGKYAAERVRALDFARHERLLYCKGANPRWWVEKGKKE